MSKKFVKTLIFVFLAFHLQGFEALPTYASPDTSSRVKGKILIQVEARGEAWYVNPRNLKRYYLGRPDDAFRIMKELSLGILNRDFESYNGRAPKRLAGYILLKVQDGGRAYYVYPDSLTMHYLGRPDDAFDIMRKLGLGITNHDLFKISLGSDIPLSGYSTSQASATDLEVSLFDKLNDKRAENGLEQMLLDNELSELARNHSREMAEKNFFSSSDPEGCNAFCRLKSINYSYSSAYEYLGAGHIYKSAYLNGKVAEWKTVEETASDIFNYWDHYSSTLNPYLYYVGVGIFITADQQAYATAVLIKPIVNPWQRQIIIGTVNEIIAPEDDNRSKIKKIHDWIALNVRYDVDNFFSGTIPDESFSAYGAYGKGVAVCQGYAELFWVMADYAGIETEIITGTADGISGYGSHAWNKVTLNGENFYIDATWNAGYVNSQKKFIPSLAYTYYLIPKECIRVDHAEFGESAYDQLEQKQYLEESYSVFIEKCPLLLQVVESKI